MQNPFTTTFSKIPDHTYIPTEQTSEIIENFSYESPTESVYKITGVRGSGKTVLLAKVEEEISTNPWLNDKWILCRISPTRDMLQQLVAVLYKENLSRKKPGSLGINVSASIMGTGAGIGFNTSENDAFLDIGSEIEDLLKAAQAQGQKILIGIDEVSRTKEMIVFASEFGKWLRAGYPVYLICTGLYENIEQLSNVKNLTFFRRATTIRTEPLNFIRMSEMYKSCLHVPVETARKLATVTMGYPYAFQELGVLYFKKKEGDSDEEILDRLRTELFAYAYEKIWEELTSEDRALVILLAEKQEYSREEILPKMKKPGNYSVYRERLIRRGIITGRHGFISLALPFFNEYLKDYCIT